MSDNDTFRVSGNDGADVFTERTERNWFGRFGESMAGALIGLVLFFGSLILLSWNEGRAVDAITALNAGAKAVVSVPTNAVQPANEGRLVHLSGPVTVSGPLADQAFRIQVMDALRLERSVEMYQWQEKTETTTESSVGGGETKTTTYRYSREWSESAVDSNDFRKPEGHANPAMPYKSATIDARGAALGAFRLDRSQIEQIDAFEPLPQDSATSLPQGFRWEGEQLYRGASPDQPRVGDLRVTFRFVPAQTISVVAGQTGSTLTPFHGERGQTINLVEVGTRSADAMFAQARSEENILTWILRGVGFLLMLFGIVLLGSPLAWLASVLPFLESVVNVARFGFALSVAIPLTLLTIALAWLAHRPLIGAGLIVAGILATIAIRRLMLARGRASSLAPGASR